MTEARYWSVTNDSSIPWRLRSSKMCPRQGLSTMGTIGLGRLIVSGRRRLPSPPAMTTACIGPSLVGGCSPTERRRTGGSRRDEIGDPEHEGRGCAAEKDRRRQIERGSPGERLDRGRGGGERGARNGDGR